MPSLVPRPIYIFLPTVILAKNRPGDEANKCWSEGGTLPIATETVMLVHHVKWHPTHETPD